MAIDRSHLEKHRTQWRVRVKVPENVRDALGGKLYLKQALGTGDLAAANLLKGEHVTRFKRLIEDAKGNSQPGSILDEARAMRRVRAEHTPQYELRPDLDEADENSGVLVERDDASDAIEHRAEQIAAREGPTAAKSYADVAFGRTTPITDYLEDFIGSKGYRPKSVLDLRLAIKRLEAWLASQRRPTTLQAVDQAVAGQFMRDLIHRLGLSRKNGAKYVSFLRSYWAWLEEQGHRPANGSPWLGKVPQPKAIVRSVEVEDDAGKRPFTSDELLALLAGKPSQSHIADLVRIAALSGMRLEEIYLLRVRDCADSSFNIRRGKTTNAVRRVPIHPDLEAIVKRLVDGKAQSTYLLDPDAPIIEKTDIRSAAASKAFGYYRRKLNLDERPNGKLKSNIEFHSLRRWFIQQARNALDSGATGFTPWTIADVVGHDDEDMKGMLRLTMQHYAGPSAEDARRACVQAVSLPAQRQAKLQ